MKKPILMDKRKKEQFDLTTSLGTIRGEIVAAPDGTKIARFLGIPYARAPIGDLRFKPLQPLELPQGTEDSPYGSETRPLFYPETWTSARREHQ